MLYFQKRERQIVARLLLAFHLCLDFCLTCAFVYIRLTCGTLISQLQILSVHNLECTEKLVLPYLLSHNFAALEMGGVIKDAKSIQLLKLLEKGIKKLRML